MAHRAQGPSAPERPRFAGEFRPTLSIRARVREDEVAPFTRAALREIRVYIEREHLRVEGPPFSLCRTVSDGQVDVEAGWPTSGGTGRGRIHAGMLPVRARLSR